MAALEDVSLEVKPGERVALVGENGAGKSSLMNVLYGLYQPDAGEVWIDGARRRLKSPRDAIAAGIGMVHQHFMLVPTLSASENVVLGHEPRRGLLFDRKAAREGVLRTARRLGFTLDPDARVDAMTLGAQQKLEIVKALHRGARVLILDEPTAVLTPQESDELFAVTRQLAAEGTAVVFISHKLKEVLSAADRIVVMRRGRKVAEVEANKTTAEELSAWMVGDASRAASPQPARASAGAALLSLQAVSAEGRPSLREVTLEVRPGELVGIAGVDGNGQRELAELLVGLRPPSTGTLTYEGAPLAPLDVAQRRAKGVVHIPEDRLLRAMVGPMSVEENASLGRHRAPPFARGGWIDRKGRRARTESLLEEMDVRPRSPELRAAALSGGNQQKLVVGRELAGEPKLIVAVQPTRGLDIAAVASVHRRLREACAKGAGAVVISLDLDELRELCDRIYVLFEGRVTGEVSRGELDERAVGRLMLGVTA